MALHRVLESSRFSLFSWLHRASPRHARRVATIVPVVACMPGSDVWFLRFAIAFLAHLTQGGQIADRLRGRIVGSAAGRPFNFDHVRGGPLLWVPGLVNTGHLFVGHTICPGFSKITATVPWWQETRFCAPGYDYFREGLNYAQVPVDLAPHAYTRVSVNGLDTAAWARPTQRAVLVYADPLEQAASYFHHCWTQSTRAGSMLGGRRLEDWTFRDYLFDQALPSYAKIFISYQVMETQAPGSVSLVPYQRMRERPAQTLASMLTQLTGKPQSRPLIADAVDLARQEHLAAVEIELGRPLDRARRRRGGRKRDIPEAILREQHDPDLRREAVAFLASLGVDSRYFTPSADAAASGG